MAGTLVSGLLGYAFHSFVAREISVAQYGELQSLLSAMLIFGVFNSALSYFVLKHTSVFAAHDDYVAAREFTSELTPKVFKLTAAILLVLLIASPLLARLLHFSSMIGFLVVSLATFFSTMSVIYSEILRGWQKFFLLSFIGVIITFTKFTSGAAFAFLSHKTAIVSLSFLITSFTSWYLVKYWSQKTINRKMTHSNTNPPASLREQPLAGEALRTGWRNKYFSETNIRKSAVNIFLFSLTLILVSNIDVILVKYFSSPDIAGYFGAFALVGKIILWLNLSVASVLLPEACAAGYKGKRPEKFALLYSYALMLLIGFGATIFYYLFPNFVINIFFGQKYIYDPQVLWLFGLMTFFLSLLTFEANLSFAKHDFRVVYLLVATFIIMIAGMSKFHASLEQIVLVFSASFFVSYFAILFLNINQAELKPRTQKQ
jgi:O-antigen/teichoic acid export membrane protein